VVWNNDYGALVFAEATTVEEAEDFGDKKSGDFRNKN